MEKKGFFFYMLTVSRILVGLVFIFSGFVKGVDPLGTTYKLLDYAEAFNIDISESFALGFSIFLNLSEFVLGVALLLGVCSSFFILMALLYMLVFTPLTFVLAIYNPVTDCGCFGDAIVMTNWQTFYKNIIISAFVVLLALNFKNIHINYIRRGQWCIIFISVFFFIFLSIYSYRHLPVLDFRPYNVGSYIPGKMIIPEDAPRDSFEIVHTYQKNGILKEFNPGDIPWQDTSWIWVETKSKLVKRGYHPPIHDFSFINTQGEDITEDILNDTSVVFLAISHKLDNASTVGLDKLKELYNHCQQHHYSFYFATASTSEQIHEYTRTQSLPYEFCSADDIMLKTVIRANPGLMLIKKGTIIGKWHCNDFPDVKDLPAIYVQANSEIDKHSDKL